ncbi:MAG: ABC transporter ATP-binding protein [Bacteroidaceae bacterium]|nr:ABC transporter ATP-binding protein [Bacteroidaceae bacterium]
MHLIKLKGITKSFEGTRVLKGIDLTIEKGEIVSITGPSGAGKSTLLHIMGGLDKPDTGQVIYNGTDIAGFSGKETAMFRNRNIGFVFQFHELLPEFTALENIMMPALIGDCSKSESEKRAMQILGILNLQGKAGNKPAEMSGGENQRIAVARALMNNPQIILADEPSGSLDSGNRSELHNLFFKLREELGQTFVIITHDESLASKADRTIRLRDGRII